MPRSLSSAVVPWAPRPPTSWLAAGYRTFSCWKQGLCAATSSQAAGMVGQARPGGPRPTRHGRRPAVPDLRGHHRLRDRLPREGAVRLALSERSEAELLEIAATARTVMGPPVEFLDPAKADVRAVPVLAGTPAPFGPRSWSPTCGYLQPNSLVTAYVAAARDLGDGSPRMRPVTATVSSAARLVTTPHGTVRDRARRRRGRSPGRWPWPRSARRRPADRAGAARVHRHRAAAWLGRVAAVPADT